MVMDAVAIAVNTVHVYVLCPHCGKVHVHGSSGDITKEDYGYRVPHCAASEEYRIVTDANTVRKSGVFSKITLKADLGEKAA